MLSTRSSVVSLIVGNLSVCFHNSHSDAHWLSGRRVKSNSTFTAETGTNCGSAFGLNLSPTGQMPEGLITSDLGVRSYARARACLLYLQGEVHSIALTCLEEENVFHAVTAKCVTLAIYPSRAVAVLGEPGLCLYPFARREVQFLLRTDSGLLVSEVSSCLLPRDRKEKLCFSPYNECHQWFLMLTVNNAQQTTDIINDCNKNCNNMYYL